MPIVIYLTVILVRKAGTAAPVKLSVMAAYVAASAISVKYSMWGPVLPGNNLFLVG